MQNFGSIGYLVGLSDFSAELRFDFGLSGFSGQTCQEGTPLTHYQTVSKAEDGK